jgi:hypothetical protein
MLLALYVRPFQQVSAGLRHVGPLFRILLRGGEEVV